MTRWLCVTLSLAILCLLVYCLEEGVERQREPGIPFYWSASDGRLVSPKIRHYHPKLPSYNEDTENHSLKYKKHHRRSHGHMKYGKYKGVKGHTNSTKMICRDETQAYSEIEEEVCPEFAAEIGNITQAVGRDAKMECVVDHLGRFRVAWMRIETETILTMHQHVISRNYRISLSHSEHRIYVLHIRDVQESDRGAYMCQVNTVPMLYQIGHLDVVVPPDIIEEESSSDMFVREGVDVTLRCAARGRPEPKLTWRREDHKPMGAGNWQGNNLAQIIRMADDTPSVRNESLHEGAELTIRRVSRLHMGAYLCIASNGVPPAVSRRITLQVNFPPMMWIPNQLVGAQLGGNVTVECNTEAYPESINYWSRHESEMISHGGGYDVIFKITTCRVNMILTIHRVVHSDFGTYRCFARNSLGSTEGTIRIYEIHVPQPIKEPSTAKIHSLDGTSGTREVDSDYEREEIRKELERQEREHANKSIKVSLTEDRVDSGSSSRHIFLQAALTTVIVLSTFWTNPLAFASWT